MKTIHHLNSSRKDKKGISNNLLLLLIRLVILYVVWGGCRVAFYFYNADILPAITTDSIWSILKASFIFDSASIFYVNILFVFLSLIPFYFRERKFWQRVLGVVFIVTNGVALLVNLIDIFYFPYKLSRTAGDDLRYLGEDNFLQVMLSGVAQFWWVLLIYILFLFVLYWLAFVLIRPKKGHRAILSKPIFYILQFVIMCVGVIFSITAIRGFSISKATFPITVSDATLYVKPKYSSLVLSNPFCVIRTASHSLEKPNLVSKERSEQLYNPVKQVVPLLEPDLRGMNIVILVLESFGTAHIKSLSDSFKEGAPSFTPFLDSLFNHGVIMPNAYQSGGRSIDAMPAIWASIPSYKSNFLALPQSQSTYNALPSIMKNMGYSTAFMHGAVSSSMSFKAFGRMAGVDNFVFQEDYEAEVSRGDFDGKWGIWDHKFLPYTIRKIDRLSEPFFVTIFTLSSHHPFLLPPDITKKYPEGREPIQRTIAYSDDALRSFFELAKSKSWYQNTLFIITADHGSGADNAKWKGAPYSHRVPLFFYTPSGILPADTIKNVVAHVDIMPTLLSIMGYEKPFFGYGHNIFADEQNNFFAVHKNMGTYNVVTDNYLIQFNDVELVGIYDYKSDLELKSNLSNSGLVSYSEIELYKAYIQNYFTRVEDRRFI